MVSRREDSSSRRMVHCLMTSALRGMTAQTPATGASRLSIAFPRASSREISYRRAGSMFGRSVDIDPLGGHPGGSAIFVHHSGSVNAEPRAPSREPATPRAY
jgi:hypothetical protein